jgi:hypothetical protein
MPDLVIFNLENQSINGTDRKYSKHFETYKKI